VVISYKDGMYVMSLDQTWIGRSIFKSRAGMGISSYAPWTICLTRFLIYRLNRNFCLERSRVLPTYSTLLLILSIFEFVQRFHLITLSSFWGPSYFEDAFQAAQKGEGRMIRPYRLTGTPLRKLSNYPDKRLQYC